MKLEKFKEKNHKRTVTIVFTIICILLVGGVILYRTFAIFEVKTNQNVIKGNVQDPGNIYFAFYQKNEETGNYDIQKEMPSKDNGYVLDEVQSYCGVNGSQDDSITVSLTEDWQIIVNGVTTSRTKCNLYFTKGVLIMGHGFPIVTNGDGLYEVSHDDLTGTINDDGFQKSEYRFAGQNPNNYVWFNEELWRIIGLVNVMTDEHTVEQRVKIIKSDSLDSSLSWDTSETGINNGRGVNEWSNSHLMKALNPGYEDIGESLYWNALTGICYDNSNNHSNPCDFTTNGLKNKYKDLIEEVFWNTGSNGNHYGFQEIDVNKFYEIERSDHISNESCEDETYCNDKVERHTTWKGKVGLIYPSDFGFASSNVAEKGICQTTQMYHWDEHLECSDSDWLYMKKGQWTITPCSAQGSYSENFSAVDAFSIRENRVRDDWITGNINIVVRPTVYLQEDVVILFGKGNSSNPYRLVLKKF